MAEISLPFSNQSKQIYALRLCWQNAIYRCHNPQNREFHNYGGRGIKVCDRWRYSFANFLADMGLRPDGRSLDRIDNDGDYEPSNCRWATPKEQSSNRRITRCLTIDGETKSLAEWADEFNVPSDRIRQRLNRGMGHRDAIFLPPFANGYCGGWAARIKGKGINLTINGITQSIPQWERLVMITRQSIRERLDKGWCGMCAVFIVPKCGMVCEHK